MTYLEAEDAPQLVPQLDTPWSPFVPFPPLPPAERRLWERQRAMLEAADVVSTPRGPKARYRMHVLEPLYRVAMRTLGWCGLREWVVRNALDIRCRELELSFASLPEAFDRYRILHMTDLHIDAIEGLDEAIAGTVRGLHVDLCVLTGDYRDGNKGPFEQILAPLAGVLDGVRSRDGIYAVLGNHDEHLMARAFEAMGLPVLVNQSVRIEKHGQAIHLTGVDDVNCYYTPAADSALDLEPGIFGIALVHSPEMAGVAASAGYGLYLCGHTHGGQVCLPGGRPLVTQLNRHHEYASGLWSCGDMTGYTSPGAGFSGMPVRVNTRGEVTVVTLRRSEGGA